MSTYNAQEDPNEFDKSEGSVDVKVLVAKGWRERRSS